MPAVAEADTLAEMLAEMLAEILADTPAEILTETLGDTLAETLAEIPAGTARDVVEAATFGAAIEADWDVVEATHWP
jgi:hypothetical protein